MSTAENLHSIIDRAAESLAPIDLAGLDEAIGELEGDSPGYESMIGLLFAIRGAIASARDILAEAVPDMEGFPK